MSGIGKLIQASAQNMKAPLQSMGDYTDSARAWAGSSDITTVTVQKIKNGFIIFNVTGDVYYCKDAGELSQRFVALLVESKMAE